MIADRVNRQKDRDVFFLQMEGWDHHAVRSDTGELWIASLSQWLNFWHLSCFVSPCSFHVPSRRLVLVFVLVYIYTHSK